MAAAADLVEVRDAGIDRLDPAARGRPDLAGERREANPDGDRGRSLAARRRCGQRPSAQYDRAADAAVPVSQYRVMLSMMLSRVRPPVGCLSTKAREILT